MDSTEKSPEALRRSTRIRAQILLRITSLDPATPFSETGHTLVLNTQGCGVRLSCPLQPGTAVSLDDLPSGKSVPARVANCVPLGTGGQWWMVGIALTSPAMSGAFIPLPPTGVRKPPPPQPLRPLPLPARPRAANGPSTNSPVAENSTPAKDKLKCPCGRGRPAREDSEHSSPGPRTQCESDSLVHLAE